MYIKSIHIKDFKGIRDMSLEFKQGINLLTGDNGMGKTSVLEAIVIALNGLLMGVKGVSVRSIHENEIRFSLDEKGDASSGKTFHTPVEIGCTMDIDGTEFTWIRSREDEASKRNTKINDKSICDYMKKITNDMETVLPLICFESDARVWQSRRGDFGKNLKAVNDRRCGYIGCLDYSMDVKGILQWCLKMEIAGYQKKKTISEYEAFKNSVSCFMQKMCELPEKPEVYYSVQMEELVYHYEGNDMPVSALSAGYQSLLWMIMNMAYRLAILNPSLGENMRLAPGVILIDEIDMHLHPKWQWNVLIALQETFPNFQFIAATHSPIVISSCKNGLLLKIDEEQNVISLPEAYGYSVKDVLELRQQSSEKPVEIQRLLTEFEKALNRDDSQGAEQITDQLEQKLGANHSEVKTIREELRNYLWVQEN